MGDCKDYVKAAAKLQLALKVALQDGKYTYHISPGLLVAYKRGTLNIQLKPERIAE